MIQKLFLSVLLLSMAAGPLVADTVRTGKSGADAWGRNYFPNVELISHEGKKVRFFDDLIAGKVVVINFIYTTCPDACPLETARLAEVQHILGGRVGKDVHFYSITIDPERDTPEVLAEYRERYQAAEGWSFFTGAEKDIVLLRKKLGLYIDDIDQEAGDHNLNLVIGNQSTGRWQKSTPFENPYVLAKQIGEWLPNYTHEKKERNDYADAPELRNISDGEKLFRTRCQVCHTIGTTGPDALKPRVGPNLQGVTDRREHDWLVRWIKEPDVMLEEGDSIALGLFYAYNEVPMPNMRLSTEEAEQLIDYIKTESGRVEKHEQLLTALPPKPAEGEVAECCLKGELGTLAEDGDTLAAAEEDCCSEDGESCCEDGDMACCEEEMDCCSEKEIASAEKPTSRSGIWSGVGVALGGLALALRRRAL